MIEKISVTNFKSHAHTEIELGRVTALVGPNGCGKTSILQALHLLSRLTDEVWNTLLTGDLKPATLVRRGENECIIKLAGKFSFLKDTPEDWKVKVGIHNTDTLGRSTENWRLMIWHEEKVPETSNTVQEGFPLSHVLDITQAIPLKDIAYFKPTFDQLAQPSYSEKIPPTVGTNGGDLASTFAYLMTAEPERYQQVEEQLKEIVPIVEAVRVRPAKITRSEKRMISVDTAQFPIYDQHEIIGQELIFDTINTKTIPAHAMSNGTLLVLGILTLLQNPTKRGVILLDDVEQGLHPLAQRRLIKTLRTFAEQQNKQILLTTHSAYIIDELEDKDVWVMTTDQAGISHSRRLSEHKDAKRLLEVLTTGELADAVGEDWVLQPPALAGEANA